MEALELPEILFVHLVKGGDIQRTGSVERDLNNAGRTAVLHMARGMHLDQTVFGREFERVSAKRYNGSKTNGRNYFC